MDKHERIAKAAQQVDKRIGFYVHSVVFLLVCGGLAAVNLFATPEVWWAQWPFLGWGVAVVCGAGINCVGVAPDGRHARFPALGWVTGDWGGGHDVGIAAVSAAARSEDGRGPKTTLEEVVPAHFGFTTPSELAEAILAAVDRIRARLGPR